MTRDRTDEALSMSGGILGKYECRHQKHCETV